MNGKKSATPAQPKMYWTSLVLIIKTIKYYININGLCVFLNGQSGWLQDGYADWPQANPFMVRLGSPRTDLLSLLCHKD
jgi:hypothetical protein